jgi:hypothetical protein
MSGALWEALSTVGAVTGVPALGWEIWKFRAEAPKIELRTANGFPTYGGRLAEHHFQVTVIDKGRAEGRIQLWGLKLPDGSNMFDVNPLPFSDHLGPIAANGGRLTFTWRPAASSANAPLTASG